MTSIPLTTPPQLTDDPTIRSTILALQKQLLDQAALLIVESEIMLIQFVHQKMRGNQWDWFQTNTALLGLWRDVRKAVSETVGIHSSSTPSIIVQQINRQDTTIISPGVLQAISQAFATIPESIRQPLIGEYERDHQYDGQVRPGAKRKVRGNLDNEGSDDDVSNDTVI
jgi:hypothetical protein